MIESALISEIIELTVEGEKFENMLFEQINYLTIKEKEHTGVGLFVYLKQDKGIMKINLNNFGTKKEITELNGYKKRRLTEPYSSAYNKL